MCQQRKCLPLHKNTEEVLDKDLVIFVSISAKLEEEIRFLFADRTPTNRILRAGMNWKNLDGTEMIS